VNDGGPLPEKLAVPRRPAGLSQGRTALLGAATLLGGLMLGIQLWLLTTALDLYLAGEGERLWQIALASALIFAGGVLAVVLTGALQSRRR
jgi:hypothetical protein